MNVAPMTGTLDRGRRRSHRGCDFGALLAPTAPEGVLTLERMVGDRQRLDALLDAVGEDVGSARRDVQASLFLEGYAWTLGLPLAGALFAERRAPGLAHAAVTLRATAWPQELVLADARFAALADDPDADDPAAVVVTGESELAGWLRAELICHLKAPVAELAAHTGRSERALWRSVGDRAAAAMLFAGEAGGDVPRAATLAGRLLSGPGPLTGRPDYRTIVVAGEPMRAHVRTGCCLWWRTQAAGCCATCPLTMRDARPTPA